jgi:hypothetical protein
MFALFRSSPLVLTARQSERDRCSVPVLRPSADRLEPIERGAELLEALALPACRQAGLDYLDAPEVVVTLSVDREDPGVRSGPWARRSI